MTVQPEATTVKTIAERVCNWRTWGEADQRGTPNYITPEAIVDACSLVELGEVVSLGLPFDKAGPQVGHPRRFNPIHLMTALLGENVRAGGVSSADDLVILPLQAGTQWDALAHVAHGEVMYGNRPIGLVTSTGAKENGIEHLSDKVIGRGVLLDIAATKGVDSLSPGEAITTDELERAADAAGVEFRQGDILLVRTGFLAQCRARAWEGFGGSAPGLSVYTLDWIHEKKLAAVAADTTAVEVKPAETPGEDLPFHSVALVYMGLLLGEIFDLEALSVRCRELGRHSFLFVAPPLPVTGGLGSPINPYAVL